MVHGTEAATERAINRAVKEAEANLAVKIKELDAQLSDQIAEKARQQEQAVTKQGEATQNYLQQLHEYQIEEM